MKMTKSVILISLILLVTFIQITELRGIRGSWGRSYRRPTYTQPRQNVYRKVAIAPLNIDRSHAAEIAHRQNDAEIALRQRAAEIEHRRRLDFEARIAQLGKPNPDSAPTMSSIYDISHLLREARPIIHRRSDLEERIAARRREPYSSSWSSIYDTSHLPREDRPIHRPFDDCPLIERKIAAASTTNSSSVVTNRTANPERKHRERRPSSLNSTRSQRRKEALRLTEEKTGDSSRTNESFVFFNRTASPVNETERSLKNGLIMDGSTPRFDDDSRRTNPVTDKCSQSLQDPPCPAVVKRWFYHPRLKRCTRGRCGLESAFFITKKDCVKTCM